MHAQNCNDSTSLFVLQCNVFYSVDLPRACKLFVCSIWISIYTSATRVFEKPCKMDVYIRLWLLVLQLDIFLWCPKIYKCNWVAKEIHIQQPNIYKKSLYEDVYIRRWLLAKYMKDVYIRPLLLAWMYFGRKRNVRGRIYTSLVGEVQIEWVLVERIKDVYIHLWLLKKICSARKGCFPVLCCKIFRKKLSFLTPWYAHVCAHIRG